LPASLDASHQVISYINHFLLHFRALISIIQKGLLYVEAEVATGEDGTERAIECLSLIDAVMPDVVASRRAPGGSGGAGANAAAATERMMSGGNNAGGDRAGGAAAGIDGGQGVAAGQMQDGRLQNAEVASCLTTLFLL
jgi:transducin (beta)-like 1